MLADLITFLERRLEDEQRILAGAHDEVRAAAGPLSSAFAVQELRERAEVRRALFAAARSLLTVPDLPMEKQVHDVALEMLQVMTHPYRDHPDCRGGVVATVGDGTGASRLIVARCKGQRQPQQGHQA